MDLNKEIQGKTIAQWMDAYPIMKEIADLKETAWVNPERLPFAEAMKNCPLTMADVQEASDRLARFDVRAGLNDIRFSICRISCICWYQPRNNGTGHPSGLGHRWQYGPARRNAALLRNRQKFLTV